MLSSSQSGPEISTRMAFGAGPLYTNAIMGQGPPSAAEREHAREASSSILSEDSIQVVESVNTSFPEAWPLDQDYTSRNSCSPSDDGNMMTQGSILRLPKDNASHDLAFFLQSTGPTAPHRAPSKVDRPRRAIVGSKTALRLLKLRKRRHEPPELRDEGGLLIPSGVEQKVSSAGMGVFHARF